MSGNRRLARRTEEWARNRSIGLYWDYLLWRAWRAYCERCWRDEQ